MYQKSKHTRKYCRNYFVICKKYNIWKLTSRNKFTQLCSLSTCDIFKYMLKLSGNANPKSVNIEHFKKLCASHSEKFNGKIWMFYGIHIYMYIINFSSAHILFCLFLQIQSKYLFNLFVKNTYIYLKIYNTYHIYKCIYVKLNSVRNVNNVSWRYFKIQTQECFALLYRSIKILLLDGKFLKKIKFSYHLNIINFIL